MWREPVLAALCGSSDNVRTRVGIYLLPLVLELDEMSMVDLVVWILETLHCPNEGRAASEHDDAGKQHLDAITFCTLKYLFYCTTVKWCTFILM